MDKTLIEYFYEYEKEHSESPFLNQPFGDNWETYTWAEAGEKARRLATWLRKQTTNEKAHVSIVSKNCREWVIADIAIMMAGFVSVPFYANLKGNQLKQVLELGDVDILLIGKVEGWEDMKTGIPDDIVVGKFPHYNHAPKIDIGVDWQTILEEEPLQGNYIPKDENYWSIIFTSGTTGTPKGVCFKNKKLNKHISMGFNDYWLGIQNGKEERFFSYLPLNHIAERVILICALRFGVQIFFAESLESFTKNLQEARPTLFMAVPRIWTKFKEGILKNMSQKRLNLLLSLPIINNIIKKKIKEKLGLAAAKMCITGAAPMSAFDTAWWIKLGVPLSEVYGQTESFVHGCYSPVGKIQPGKVGIVHEEMEVKLEAETNQLLLKTPIIFDGYYKDPEKTAETIKDDWLYTGDTGKVYEDGYVQITGRIKDTFKTEKGQFVVPAKVECLYEQNLDIEQLCLLGLGMPHPVMMLYPSELGLTKSKEELQQSLKETMISANQELPNYMKVGTMVIAQEPFTIENGLLTPTLKVKRFKMNEKYEDKLRAYCEDEKEIIWESIQ